MNTAFDDKPKLTADLLRPQCRGRWLEIFQSLCPGMFDEAIQRLGNHVTCPFHGGDEDFRFTKRATKKGGSTADCGVAMCTCGFFTDGFSVLQRAMNDAPFIEVLKRLDEYLNAGSTSRCALMPKPKPAAKTAERSDKDIMARVFALWKSGQKLDYQAVPYYLARGLHPRILEDVQDVRSVASLGYYEMESKKLTKKGAYPALLAAMRNRKGDLVAVHRTFLSSDKKGKAPVPKAKKLSETPDATGAAIRLFDAKNADTLGLSEGVETGLAARQLALGGYWPELGPIPVWACYCKANIESFQIPDELLPTLRQIIVFSDNDKMGPIGPGLASALVFKARMAVEHPDIEVIIKLPPVIGWDWNNVLVNL